ncbi:MAG: TolC family protein [Kofleriaceae bacterium]
MRSSWLLFALAGCFHPTHASLAPIRDEAVANEKRPANPESWNLDRAAAIQYALAHGPDLADRRDQEAVAEAKIGAAKQLTNPQLHLGQTTEEDLLVGEQTRFVVAFRVFPDMPWALDARIAQARAGYEAERAVTTSAKLALIAQIEQLYAQLAFGQATHDILAKEATVLGERRRVLNAQLAHNTATRLEVMLADQDFADITTTITSIELATTRQTTHLSQLLGIPPGQTWKPVIDLADEQKIHTGYVKGDLEAKAFARPELAKLQAQADAADASAYQEKTKRIPWLDNIQVERSVRDNVEWAASASITLPLFSLNSGRIAAAEAQRTQYANERRRLAIDTVRAVDDAVNLVEVTGKRAKDLADQLAPATSELDQLFAAEKTAAIADPVKLLLLEERYVRAQRAMLDAGFDHRMAVIALEALVGGTP